MVPVVRLTEIFRQASESRIITAAYDINHGRVPRSPKSDELADFYFIEAEEPEAIQAMLVLLIKERIPARFGFDPKSDIQVLTPMNRSELGVKSLNERLQAVLNPPEAQEGPEVARFGGLFRIGDKVMQKRNNYIKEVFNGDVGRVTEIDHAGWIRRCPVEGSEHFPRTDPAVIMLVTHGDRQLPIAPDLDEDEVTAIVEDRVLRRRASGQVARAHVLLLSCLHQLISLMRPSTPINV